MAESDTFWAFVRWLGGKASSNENLIIRQQLYTGGMTGLKGASKYGRKCAICGGRLGSQCMGGVWTNDWCDFMEGKITAAEIRESCAFCLNGEPSYMWGKEVHDAILERRRKRIEEQTCA
jgi:hypothetical protein